MQANNSPRPNLNRPSLESMHFNEDILQPQPPPVDHPNHPNVNTVRGSFPASPLNLSPPRSLAPTTVEINVQHFISSISAPCSPPVLPTPPPRRRLKSPVVVNGSAELPRRSKRVAVQCWVRASNPVVQAWNVLMRKLGITSTERPPDADAYIEYTELFNVPLTSTHRAAIRTLFHGEPPAPDAGPDEEQ